MNNFTIVQSICRLGLADRNPMFRKQVERLRDRLVKDNEADQAKVLQRLLDAEASATGLEPSRVELSRFVPKGEELTETTSPPVDRESSAPLAAIVLRPQNEFDQPLFEPELERAINAVINEWENLEALSRLGVSPPRSCLLFGAPGTGKTLTSMSLAGRLGLPVVVAKLDGLVSSFLGTTARNIANLFEFANRYRCVLLLDEFDAIAKLRDDPQEVGEIKRVVNTLLQNLDERAAIGITIAVTNHPALLDPAIWRRFEVRIEMPLPARAQREALIRHFIKPLDITEPVIQLITWATRGNTGADIKTMTNAIKRHVALAGSNANDVSTILDGLSIQSRTSALFNVTDRLSALRSDPKSIARALLQDEEMSFTQAAIAGILGRDQATISRWLRDDASDAN